MDPNLLNRRRFCQIGLSAPLAAYSAQAAAQSTSKTDDRLAVIDTHQHLWDLAKFQLPWLADYSPLRRSYSLADYWKAAEGTNIVKTVYMEVDVAPDQREAEVDQVVALAKKPESRMAAAVVGGQPESPKFSEYVRRLTASRTIKGVRAPVRTRGTGAELELNRDFVAGVRLLGKHRLSFDINVSPELLSQAAALIDQAPETAFIVDHCGNIAPDAKQRDFEAWKSAMAKVATRKPVVCKISGFISNSKGRKPKLEEIAVVVDHVYECFGPDRVMFGGDWPVCTLAMPLAEWVATLRQVVADRPIAMQKKLFYDNAARIYAI